MQFKLFILAALAGSVVALPTPAPEENVAAAGASLEDVETAAWYGWIKKRDEMLEAGASLEDVETAAWYGWVKKRDEMVAAGASLEDVETAAWYGWLKKREDILKLKDVKI